MTRLVFSGIMEKYPNLKVMTHHCGGMVPYYEERIKQHHDKYEMGMHRRGGYKQGLTRRPIEYYKMFYNDTAIHGNTPARMCAYAFWGADHLLFGADMPLGDRELGAQSYRKTINAIEQMSITDAEKKKIFEDNARHLMRLKNKGGEEIYLIHASGKKGKGGTVKKVLLKEYLSVMPFIGVKITRFQ